MNDLLREAWSIWRAGGPLMVPLSALAFGVLFAETRLLLRIRRILRDPLPGPSPEEDARPRRQRPPTIRFAAARDALLLPVDRRIRFHGILVGICPLVGLLGTVAGMTSTFDGLARPGLSNLSHEVAGGISEALVTTQAGLLVAIPGMMLLALLRRGRDRIALRLFAAEARFLDERDGGPALAPVPR